MAVIWTGIILLYLHVGLRIVILFYSKNNNAFIKIYSVFTPYIISKHLLLYFILLNEYIALLIAFEINFNPEGNNNITESNL